MLFKYPVLVIRNTVVHPALNQIVSWPDCFNSSADQATPLAGAQHAATLLCDNSFLVEQLGFSHTSLAQTTGLFTGASTTHPPAWVRNIDLRSMHRFSLPDGRLTTVTPTQTSTCQTTGRWMVVRHPYRVARRELPQSR